MFRKRILKAEKELPSDVITIFDAMWVLELSRGTLKII